MPYSMPQLDLVFLSFFLLGLLMASFIYFSFLSYFNIFSYFLLIFYYSYFIFCLSDALLLNFMFY